MMKGFMPLAHDPHALQGRAAGEGGWQGPTSAWSAP